MLRVVEPSYGEITLWPLVHDADYHCTRILICFLQHEVTEEAVLQRFLINRNQTKYPLDVRQRVIIMCLVYCLAK
jgi:hypothetical protein